MHWMYTCGSGSRDRRATERAEADRGFDLLHDRGGLRMVAAAGRPAEALLQRRPRVSEHVEALAHGRYPFIAATSWRVAGDWFC